MMLWIVPVLFFLALVRASAEPTDQHHNVERSLHIPPEIRSRLLTTDELIRRKEYMATRTYCSPYAEPRSR